MKNIIVFILALLISVNLSAQTKQPGQKKLNYLGSNIFLDQHQDFKQSNFVIGWHWGSMKVLSRALLMNQGDISTTKEFSFYSEGDFNTNTNYFVRAYYDTVIDGQPKEGYLYSHCLYDNFIVFTRLWKFFKYNCNNTSFCKRT